MRKHYSFKDYLSTQTPAFRKKLRKEVAKLKKNHEMITEFDNIVCQLQDIWDKLIDIGFWQIENLPAGRGIVVHDDETLATFSGEKFCILI